MYSGFSKNNGSVIGDTSQGVNVDIGEAQETTAAEESLVCMDEQGNELVLNARIDESTGEIAWVQLYSSEDVMNRTVSMSQMTSMLRDKDRNNVYERAIQVLIDSFIQAHGRAPVVLDVGAGTGLLSMFAARSGAEFVIAVEMFNTMANIAERVVGANDFGDKILVVNAKSSEIEDLPVLPDLLISELLDSALLGEGCVPAHTDAINRLLNPQPSGTEQEEGEGQDSYADRVLPYSGLVYGTLIQSTEVLHMHDVASIAVSDDLTLNRTPAADAETEAPAKVPVCGGGCGLVPVHWTELLQRGARELSAAVPVLHANFTLTPADATATYAAADTWQYTDVTATEDGTVHGVLLYWTLYLLSPALDPQRSLTYSTAPGAQNWQDHWQQTVYPLPQPLTVRKGDVLRVYAMHDNVHIQVHVERRTAADNVTDGGEVQDTKRTRTDPAAAVGSVSSAESGVMTVCEEIPDALQDDFRTLCTCGWHMLCGAERFQMLSDDTRRQAWQAAVDALVAALPEKGVVMDLSDGSLLGLMVAAKLRAADKLGVKVVSKEGKQFSRLFFGQLCDANELEDAFVWDGQDVAEVADFLATDGVSDGNSGEGEDGGEKENDAPMADLTVLNGAVVAVLCECYFYQLSALPTWQALSYYYQLQALRAQNLLSLDCRVIPGRALVRAVALELPQLRHCHGLANRVCDFDHAELDVHQQDWHTHMYPYKLASYQYTALSDAITLGVINFSGQAEGCADAFFTSGDVVNCELPLVRQGRCDGIAVWVDYELTAGSTLSCYKDGRFAHNQTVNIKFLPAGRGVEAGDRVNAVVQLDAHRNDFAYEFSLL